MANEFKIKKGLIVTGADGGTVVDIQGSQGQLFSVTDDLSGSIFAVSDISGVPILDVNSSGLVTVDGPFTQTGGGATTLSGTLNVDGVSTLANVGYLGDGLGSVQYTFQSANNGFATIDFGDVADSNIGRLSYSHVDDSFLIRTNNATALTLDSAQNAAFAGDVTVTGTSSTFNTGNSGTFVTNDGDGYPRLTMSSSSAQLGLFRSSTAVGGMYIGADVNGFRIMDASFGTKFSLSQSGAGVFSNTVTSPTFSGDLNGTINTVTTAVTKANATNDTTVATTAFVQNLIGTIPAGLVFQGTWDAATNTPTLTSGSGTTGHFYIVSTSGSTDLDGVTDWVTGDWAVFIEQGLTDAWEKIDNSSVLDGAGTGQTVALWSGSGTSNTLTDAPITVSGNDTTFAGDLNLSAGKKLQYNANSFITPENNTSGAEISTAGTFIVKTGTTPTLGLTLDASQNATIAGNVTAADLLTVNGDGHLFLGATAKTPKIDMMYVDSPNGIGWDTRIFIGKTDDLPNAQAFPTSTIAGGFGTQYQANSDGAFFGIIPYATGHYRPVINWGDDAADSPFSFQFNGTNVVNIDVSGNVGGNSFSGDHRGTINTATTGVTQTAGDNSTKIATTAYADAAAAAVPVGDYLPLAGGTLTGALAGTSASFTGALSSVGYSGTSGTFSASVTASGNSNTFGNTTTAALIATSGTFSASVTAAGNSNTFGATTVTSNLTTNGIFTIQNAAPYIQWKNAAGTRLSYIQHNDTNLVISADTGQIQLDTTADNDILINPGGTGNVGIGTTSPATTLEVMGAIPGANRTVPLDILTITGEGDNLPYTGSGGGIVFKNRTYTYGLLKSARIRSYIDSDSASNRGAGLVFEVTDLNQTYNPSLFLKYDGNVGIGTTTPSTPLQVNGIVQIKTGSDTAFYEGASVRMFGSQSYTFRNSPGQTRAIINVETTGVNAGNLSLYNAGTVLTTKLNNAGDSYFNGGNVGIGVTSPGAKLDVVGPSGGDPILKLQRSGVANYDFFVSDAGAGAAQMFQRANTTDTGFIFQTKNDSAAAVNALTIAPSGNVGIGTTNPRDALEIEGNIRFTASEDYFMIKPDSTNQGGAFIVGDGVDAADTPVMSLSGLYGGKVTIQTTVGTSSLADKTAFDVQGTQGQLFSVTDDLSGDIFSVADISGVPIMNVNSDGTSYFDGNVGIGTTSPSEKLQVDGAVKFGQNSNIPEAAISHYTNGYLYIKGGSSGLAIGNNDYNANIYLTNGDAVQISTSGSDRMIINSAGNVGIGTTSPETNLMIYDTVSEDPAAPGSTTAGMFALNASGQATLSIGKNSANTFWISNVNRAFAGPYYYNIALNPLGGNVGIGVTNPGTKLDIAVTPSAPWMKLINANETAFNLTTYNNGTNNGSSAYAFKHGLYYNSTENAAVTFYRGGSSVGGFLTFTTNNGTERMRIDSNGDVGIGVTNPLVKLHVNQGNTSGTVIKASGIQAQIEIQTSTAGDAHLYMRPNSTGQNAAIFKMTAGTNYNWRWQDDATTPVVFMQLSQSNSSLSVKGDIIAYGSPSDERYKENIKPIESALDKVTKLQGVTFDWKKSDNLLDIKEDIGFIAQDVQKVVPELVRENEDGKLSLRYQGITPILLEAIKELKAEIDLLKSKPCNCNKCNCNI